MSSPRSIWTLIGVETLCLLGAEIARYGISVWIYRSTESVSAFSALLVANLVPGMLARPLAGSIVDRSSRKLVMIGASLVTLAGTLLVFGGALIGELSMPVVLVGAGIASIGEAFQWPALAATLPLLASDDELPRYNGLLESGRAIGRFAGPAIGGVSIALVGITGLLAFEVASFAVATAVVATMHIPNPEGAGDEPGSLWSDTLVGFRWIASHRPMLKFLLVATFANFFLAIGEVVTQPYGLSLLSERTFGIVNGLFGAGMIVGGMLCGVLADRLGNIQQFFASAIVVGLCYIAFGFARDPVTFGAIDFTVAAMMTICNAAIMTVWQIKVPDELQGRVFSAMGLLADLVTPASFIIAAPLAESVAPAVFRHTSAGSIWGASTTGEMGMMFSAMGVLIVVGFLFAASVRDVRQVEASVA